MGSPDASSSRLAPGLVRLVGRALLIAVLVYAIYMVADWATRQAEAAGSTRLMIGVFAGLLVAYALLMAVPFMPGIEVGISLLMLKGAAIAPLVYGATVLGLILAYLVGRYLPYAWLHGAFRDFRLTRAADTLEWLEPLSGTERLAHLADRLPLWLRPILVSWRYLTLAAVLNLPGNAVLGGGGGIALMAGFSRLFRLGPTLLVILIAVLPVPLAVYVGGTVFLR
jgi:hypothetical protein